MNWEEARDNMAATMTEHLKGLVGTAIGEADDIRDFVQEVASDSIEAIRIDRKDLVDEIRGQIKVRAETYRISASYRVWDTIDLAIKITTNTLVGLLTGIEL